MLKRGLCFRINVLFTDNTDYQCDWQLNLGKMYKFIGSMLKFRDDVEYWTIEANDGTFVATQDNPVELEAYCASMYNLMGFCSASAQDDD